MGTEKSMLDELLSQIGKESPPRSQEIEKGAIRRFVNAVGDHNPLYENEDFARKSRYGGKIAPPLIAITFDRERRTRFDPRWGKGAMNAGNEFEFFHPIRPGDVITYTKKLVEVKERTGKLGHMYILIYETDCVNQKGERVAIVRWTIIAHAGVQTEAA